MPSNRRLSIDQIQSWLDLVNPHFSAIDPKNQAAQDAKREQKRRDALELYFQEVLPQVIAGLDQDPRHVALRSEKIHTLVSLMGFSPETTVISAAVVRPERLIVIYGAPDDKDEAAKVEHSYDIALEFLTRHKILRGSRIKNFVIDPTKPAEIYEVIRKAIAQTPTISDSSSAVVDITGGKKVMSATGGQAAWEARLPLLYVDGEYDPNLRRPWPGTECVIKLDNPSQQEQLQMRVDALNVYANRNYPLAVEAFEQCEANRTENRLDVLAKALCRVYVRWTDLDLPRLKQDVQAALDRLAEPRVQRLFHDRNCSSAEIEKHLRTLEKVAAADPLAMIATYKELAQLYQSDAFQRHDFACLLVYRGMEAIVEFGLVQCGGEDFDLRNPDWKLLGDKDELESAYVALSREVDTKGRRAEACLPHRISFVNGLALLCLVANIHGRAGMRPEAFINQMREVADKRNESVLAHGTRTLTDKDYRDMHRRAEDLSACILGDLNETVHELRAALAPVDLTPLHDPNQC